MMKHRVRNNTLSWAALVVYLLALGAGTWGAHTTVAQDDGGGRWRPRKVPAGTEFLGDRACAECHGDKVASHAQSGMARAMQQTTESKVLASHPVMSFRVGPYSYQIKRGGEQSFFTVTDGKQTISVPILYAFGQGKAGQTYILQHEGGLYEGLVSYYTEVNGLDFTIGQPRSVPPSLKEAIGRPLSNGEALNCFGCHSTGAISGGRLRLDKVTPGIRCEACHGPGGRHAAASKAGEPSARLIFNPGRLSGDELSQSFCASCHRGNDEFAMLKSMEVNNVRFQPYRVFHSKCYSDDRRISCTACHDVHEPLKRDAAYYDQKCLACHLPKGTVAGAKAGQGAEPMTAGCRVGTKDCVSCHMPKIGPTEAHFKFTDHYIRIVKPKETYPN